jgi:hypothetical protein
MRPKDGVVQVLAALEMLKGVKSVVPEVGIEPTRTCGPLDFESSASTNFTTPAQLHLLFTILDNRFS